MNQHEYDGSEDDSGISLFDLSLTLISNWRLLIFVPLLVALSALGIAFLIPPTFTASTSFLQPQQQQNANAAMLQSLGSLSGLVGGGGGLKNPADQYISLLRSKSLRDALVERLKLQEKYQTRLKEDAFDTLDGTVVLSAGKDGLITIAVSDRDPVFAAKLANAHVDELRRLVGRLALTEAQQRRQFFEKQLQQTKASLTQAEMALKKTGVNVSALKSNPGSAVNGVALLQAQITAQRVKLSSMREYATESSSEIKQALAELMALQSEQAKISRNEGEIASDGADYVSRYRDVKYYENLFELFAKQFELAKVDEARDGPIIQVIDEAQPPERKSKPKKGDIAITAFVAAWGFLLIFIFARQAWRQRASDPLSAAKLARLREAW